MFLTDISIKRPVFATVMSIILIIFGLVIFNKIAVRELPDTKIVVAPTIGHRVTVRIRCTNKKLSSTSSGPSAGVCCSEVRIIGSCADAIEAGSNPSITAAMRRSFFMLLLFRSLQCRDQTFG